jgi:hypothetical protein
MAIQLARRTRIVMLMVPTWPESGFRGRCRPVVMPGKELHVMISDADRHDARIIWDYHQLRHQPRPCDAGIGRHSISRPPLLAQ